MRIMILSTKYVDRSAATTRLKKKEKRGKASKQAIKITSTHCVEGIARVMFGSEERVDL